MCLKEAFYVLICVCLAVFQHFSPLVCSPKVCILRVNLSHTRLCLQMELNYVQCICFDDANSFSQEEGKFCGLNKNVKQFTTFSAKARRQEWSM